MYQFIKLDEDQLHQRRILLDYYGLLAQLSVIVPIFFIQIYFLIIWIQQKRRNAQHIDASSPVRKSKDNGSTISNLNNTIAKLLWWSGDQMTLLGTHIGTRGEIIGGATWLAWLLLLCFLQTGTDYMHLTKRFGIVGASQLPLHYLLAVKTPYSPAQYLTHASHETLNSVHQVLGRIVTILFYLHTAFYINFFVQASLLAKFSQANVILGLTAIGLFTLIGTSSLAPVRQWSYRIFLGIHVALSLVILPILYFHVSHLRIYILETLAILLLNFISRGLTSKTCADATISLIPGTNLVQISIPTTPNAVANRWYPGQHAYISLPGLAVKTVIAKNPFTVSSVPFIDRELRLIARIQSGNTRALASAATSHKGPQSVMIEGPYGVATHSNNLLVYDRVLLIAGGIGATFIMPIYRQLLSDLSPSTGSYRRQKIRAVWIARSKAEVAWAVPPDPTEKTSFIERLEIFITRDEAGVEETFDKELESKLEATDAEGIELEERTSLLTKSTAADTATQDLNYHAGRPDISRVITQAFSHDASERVAVIVCGPYALGQAVRKEVGHWLYKGRSAYYWNESFGL